MADLKEVKEFYHQLKILFPASEDKYNTEEKLSVFVNRVQEFSYETLIKAAVLMQIELKAFPTISEIITFCDKIDGNDRPQILDDIIKLINRYSADETRWPAQPKILVEVIARLGGLRRINSFTDQEMSFRQDQARKIHKELRDMERAGIFGNETITEIDGIRFLKPGEVSKEPIRYIQALKGEWKRDDYWLHARTSAGKPKPKFLTTAYERKMAFDLGLDVDNFDPSKLYSLKHKKINNEPYEPGEVEKILEDIKKECTSSEQTQGQQEESSY